MKKQLTIILLSACLVILAGCHNGQPKTQAKMSGVQMLVYQALILAAHGANLQLEGSGQGQALLNEASSLMRRAMSGPEMAMMHKGGHGMSAGMKRTHDLGDTAFDLLGFMMALTPDTANAPQLRQLNERLAIAASGRVMLLQSAAAGGLKPAMQEHGRKILDLAGSPRTEVQGAGSYQVLMRKLLLLLVLNGNDAPDKS